MDILKLLDELEALGENQRLKLFGHALWFDLDRFFTLVNKIHYSLPDEVKAATQITREREEIIAGAERERDRLLAQAEQEAAALVANDEITRRARRQAEDVLSQAEQEAASIRRGAEDYARRLFANLEDYAARILENVQQSRERLQVPEPAEQETRPAS